MEGSGFGVFVDMIVGLCGAVLGGIIFSHLGSGGLNEHGLIASIVVATIGAVILTLLFRSLTAAPNQPEGKIVSARNALVRSVNEVTP